MLSRSSYQHSLIAPNHGRPAQSITVLPFAIVVRAPGRPLPTQLLRTPYSVTWAPCDSRATTRHAGHLIGHPPRWQSWALGVPTPISCYSGFIYIIDVPLQGPGPVDPHLLSFPDRRLVVCILVSCPWHRPSSPSCGQPP